MRRERFKGWPAFRPTRDAKPVFQQWLSTLAVFPFLLLQWGWKHFWFPTNDTPKPNQTFIQLPEGQKHRVCVWWNCHFDICDRSLAKPKPWKSCILNRSSMCMAGKTWFHAFCWMHKMTFRQTEERKTVGKQEMWRKGETKHLLGEFMIQCVRRNSCYKLTCKPIHR